MDKDFNENLPSTTQFQYFVRHAEKVSVTHWEYKWNSAFKDVEYNRLYLLEAGRAVLHLPFSSVTLTPGNVYLVPAFAVITSELVEPMEQFYIHFKSNDFFLESLGANRVYTAKSTPVSKHLFMTVIKNANNKALAAKMRVDGALNLLLADFADSSDVKSNVFSKYEQVFLYIKKHLSEHIEIGTLASIMNVNTVYFSNSFKKTFNLSPKQYVTNKRIQSAQLKLLYTDLAIKEVAYNCGFDDEHHFMRVFKQRTGLTPTEMRNRVTPTRLIANPAAQKAEIQTEKRTRENGEQNALKSERKD